MVEAAFFDYPTFRKAHSRARPSEGGDWITPVRERRPSNNWVDVPKQKRHALKPKRPLGEYQELAHILQAIEKAIERIGALPDNWDDEGSPAYSKEVISRAAAFVKVNALSCHQRFGSVIRVPKILPGPDGSIDVHWKTAEYEMLVNISADPKAPASFYGDDYGTAKITGSFDPEKSNLGLLTWLTEHSK